MDTLNRSAIVVRPKQPFLDWLHAADPTSRELTLRDVAQELTIYLIPECDTDDEVEKVLHELCVAIFEEQLAGWLHGYHNLAPRPKLRCLPPMVRLPASFHAGRSLR